MRGRAAGLILGAVLAVIAPRDLDAQSLEEVRDEIRSALVGARYPSLILGFVDLAQERTLSGESFTLDDDPDLDVRTLRFPFTVTFDGGTRDRAAWVVEGSVSGFEGRSAFADIWSGGLPGSETRVESRWRAASVLVGIGRRFPITETTHWTPSIDLGLAHVENDGDASGPGTAITEATLDGILFDWDATYGQVGIGLECTDERRLSPRLRLTSSVRADLRHTTDLHATDRVQELDETDLVWGARSELLLDSGLRFADEPVRLRFFLGGIHFTGETADALGFPLLAEVGVGIETAVPRGVPLVRRVDLRLSTLWGEDIRGFSIGFGVKF